MLKSFAERLPILEAIADDPKQRTTDRLKALELLARYGLGATMELESRSLHVTADLAWDRAFLGVLEADPGLRAFLRQNPDLLARLPAAVQAQVLELPPDDAGGCARSGAPTIAADAVRPSTAPPI